ncbi:4-hydroxy-tetrahydrodipicolinate synthase [Mariniphaga sp.]|uniref:4-hydroxy-tetrahydrodipicolinate synthase n=1 Tax=Mariniphaga sp. TaxID=1954475 RepID=UPI003568652E
MNHPFKGAGVALVTPFTEENKIDFDALGKIIENQVKGGMDYLVALGTTAETATLTAEEKKEVVKFVKKNSAGLPVVVGMGGNDTRKIIKQIEKFDFDGVAGLLIVTPYYNKPSQEGMYRHYSEIAKTSPVPIILYNVPSRTGVNLEYETVVRLAETSDKIIAVKEASGVLSQITRINKYTPDHFWVISGDDVLALPIISIGGIGVISVIANAFPGKVSELIHLALDGKYNEARELHFELIDLFKLIFKEGNPGGIKALMHMQGTIQNELRTPLYRISEETYNEIKEAYLKLK